MTPALKYGLAFGRGRCYIGVGAAPVPLLAAGALQAGAVASQGANDENAGACVMRVLVCGGRDFNNSPWLHETLDELHKRAPVEMIIQGGATGADRLAQGWARTRGVPCWTFRADWTRYGKKAGPIRNQQMIDEGRPDVVLAFPGGAGTADMVAKAAAANLTVAKAVEPSRRAAIQAAARI